MQEASDEKLVCAWIELQQHAVGSKEHDMGFWAHKMLDDLVKRSPERAWTIIQRICTQDETDVVLSNVAAGPLEDLLLKHGDAFIGRIEAAALNSPRFRTALGMVWRNDISESIWKRVQSVAGVRH